MVGRAPTGMGISAKSETRHPNLSFFGRQDIQSNEILEKPYALGSSGLPEASSQELLLLLSVITK
jgi:hypothetical protein